ncbi:MAG: AMP-binding protein [Actinobacteria bacterium]|nr:AMP-binding protein [Actinomycetota bacterium]MCL6104207.1 AMP-binding protein [Actinomycetota bacterium]
MYPGTYAKTKPDSPACVMADTGETLTYKELEQNSRKVALWLRSRGVSQGDNVAFILPNSLRFFSIAWACARSGLYYTPINTHLSPEETAYIANDCKAKIVISDVCFDQLNTPEARLADRLTGELEMVDELVEKISNIADDAVLEGELQGADLLYSSGTTGKPKGIRLLRVGRSMDAPDAIALLSQALYGENADSVYLCPAPLYHAAPLRFSMAQQRIGATLISMVHFDPEDFLATIEKYKVTHTQVVPTMFIRLLRLDPAKRRSYDLSSLECVVHAAAPCPIDIKKAMIEWLGPIVHEYYAGTEGNGFVAIDSKQWLAHPGSVGKALVGKIHIVAAPADSDEPNGEKDLQAEAGGEELAAGQDGLVYFEGGGDFEYLGSSTIPTRHKNGWTTLGDIGHLDEEGYLYLTDRSSYMIISGGVNIYPQEVENLLITHPKVADAAVFGVPNAEMGEEVKAVVVPTVLDGKPNVSDILDALGEELTKFCRDNLAHYKCPRSIEFTDTLPRDPSGKLHKHLLRDKYWSAHQTKVL